MFHLLRDIKYIGQNLVKCIGSALCNCPNFSCGPLGKWISHPRCSGISSNSRPSEIKKLLIELFFCIVFCFIVFSVLILTVISSLWKHIDKELVCACECVCAHLGVWFTLVLKEKRKTWQLLPRWPPHTLAWTFSPGRVMKAQIAKTLRCILKGILISVQWWWVCHRRKHVLGQKLRSWKVIPGFQQLSCSSSWIFYPTFPFLCNHFWSKLNHNLFLRLPAGDLGLWSWAER